MPEEPAEGERQAGSLTEPEGVRALSADAGAIELADRLVDMLTIILGNAEQLRKQSLDTRGRERVDQLEQSAIHAAQLLARLVVFVGTKGGA